MSSSFRLLALPFFLWCASPSPCLQLRPQLAFATPPESSGPALIGAAATILVAVIALIGSIMTAKLSRQTAKDVGRKISLDDLLKPETVVPLVAVIQDSRHFVSEDGVLDALVKASLNSDRWAQFRNLILDQSLVSQMVGKSLTEQKEITRNIFGQLKPLLRGDPNKSG